MRYAAAIIGVAIMAMAGTGCAADGGANKHKKLIKEITGKPVIQSSSIVARVLKELVT